MFLAISILLAAFMILALNALIIFVFPDVLTSMRNFLDNRKEMEKKRKKLEADFRQKEQALLERQEKIIQAFGAGETNAFMSDSESESEEGRVKA